MLDNSDFLIALILASVALYGLWEAMRPKWTLEIVLDPDGVKSHRGLPLAQQQNILNFLERELPRRGQVKIRALASPRGRLRIKVAGPLDPGLQQRIRNFLLLAL